MNAIRSDGNLILSTPSSRGLRGEGIVMSRVMRLHHHSSSSDSRRDRLPTPVRCQSPSTEKVGQHTGFFFSRIVIDCQQALA